MVEKIKKQKEKILKKVDTKSLRKGVDRGVEVAKKAPQKAGKAIQGVAKKVKKQDVPGFFRRLKSISAKRKKILMHIVFVVLIVVAFLGLRAFELSKYDAQCRKEIDQERAKQERTFIFKKKVEEKKQELEKVFDFNSFNLENFEFEKKVPILMYHYIDDDRLADSYMRRDLTVLTSEFENQMKWLSENGVKTMTMTEYFSLLAQGKLGTEKIALLTFDDGYLDFYEKAAPILKKYNQKATVFLIASHIGYQAYMNWDQVKELHANGVEFGSHSMMHPNLTSLTDDKLKAEMVESKKIIEDGLGEKISFFCYPSGFFDQRVIGAVRDAGYKGAVTTFNASGPIVNNKNVFEMPRYRVFRSMSIEGFAWTLGQAYQQ